MCPSYVRNTKSDPSRPTTYCGVMGTLPYGVSSTYVGTANPVVYPRKLWMISMPFSIVVRR